MAVPKRVADRLRTALKTYQPIIAAQRDRDVSEADTVTLVKDLFSDLLGYDKYAELTSEHAIRGTYCDLAVKVGDKLRLLVEVKAIGTTLNDKHLKQAVDYAANQGVDYVVLTNGQQWKLYHVVFHKPIDAEPVLDLNLLQANPKNEDDLELLYVLTKEGLVKGALTEIRERRDATSRYVLAALLTTAEPVLSALRREVRRVSGVLVDPEAIARVLREEVIKRDAIEGEPAAEATRKVSRTAGRAIVEQSAERDGGEPASADDVGPAANGAGAAAAP